MIMHTMNYTYTHARARILDKCRESLLDPESLHLLQRKTFYKNISNRQKLLCKESRY